MKLPYGLVDGFAVIIVGTVCFLAGQRAPVAQASSPTVNKSNPPTEIRIKVSKELGLELATMEFKGKDGTDKKPFVLFTNLDAANTTVAGVVDQETLAEYRLLLVFKTGKTVKSEYRFWLIRNRQWLQMTLLKDENGEIHLQVDPEEIREIDEEAAKG